MSDLLPCPFCGTLDAMADSGPPAWFFRCRTCGARGPLGTVQTARDLWNKRPGAAPAMSDLPPERDPMALCLAKHLRTEGVLDCDDEDVLACADSIERWNKRPGAAGAGGQPVRPTVEPEPAPCPLAPLPPPAALLGHPFCDVCGKIWCRCGSTPPPAAPSVAVFCPSCGKIKGSPGFATDDWCRCAPPAAPPRSPAETVETVRRIWETRENEKSGAPSGGDRPAGSVGYAAPCVKTPDAPGEQAPTPSGDARTENWGQPGERPASEPPSCSPAEWAYALGEAGMALWQRPGPITLADLRAIRVEHFSAAMDQARREGAAAMLARYVEWLIKEMDHGEHWSGRLRKAMEETKP